MQIEPEKYSLRKSPGAARVWYQRDRVVYAFLPITYYKVGKSQEREQKSHGEKLINDKT